MDDSVRVFLFNIFSFRVRFRFNVSQKYVSSEFSSTTFSLVDSSNLDIFSFPFLAERIEENDKLLASFLVRLFSGNISVPDFVEELLGKLY